MVVLVPYDGSPLSKTALRRATEFASYRDEDVVALTVVPVDAEYLRNQGMLGADERLDVDALCARLGQEVRDIAPDATVRCETPTTSGSMAATVINDITRTIRQVANQVGASIVFVGSENAGRVSTPITSVGSPISSDPRYDVHIVRHTTENGS